MLNRRGQNVVEYSILIALVVGAAIAMQTYVKRGMQGRVKDAVDHTGESLDVAGSTLSFSGQQYEPYYQESSGDVKTNRTLSENIAKEGAVDRTGITEETRRASGAYETIKGTGTAD
ncbi:MAG: hypothetical protein PHH68_08565 [Candidatus Omnitrophica bacterium]|nr:hypothetical protein [Candidatus Omnitrophota bacterium]